MILNQGLTVILFGCVAAAFGGGVGALEPEQKKSPHAWTRALAVSQDGKYLLTTRGIFDLETGKWERVDSLAANFGTFSSDAKTFTVFGREDHTIRVYDRVTGKILRSFQLDHREVYCVAFSLDGNTVISSGDGFLKQWDMRKGKLRCTFDGRHAATVLAISADGKYVISGDRGTATTSLRMWEVDSGKQIWKAEGHSWNVYGLAFSADGKHVVSVGDTAFINFRNIKDGKLVKSIQVGQKAESAEAIVYGMCLTSTSRYVMVAPEGESLSLWEVATGKMALALQTEKSMRPDKMFILPNDSGAISSSAEEGIVHWDLQSGERIRTIWR